MGEALYENCNSKRIACKVWLSRLACGKSVAYVKAWKPRGHDHECWLLSHEMY